MTHQPENHQQAAGIGFDGEIYRKMLHLLALGYPVGFLLFPEPWGLFTMIALSVTALSLDWIRAHNPGAHAFFERYVGFMMRRQEREVLGDGPVFNGATWVTVSFTVLALLFPVNVAIVSFVLFMIGDAAAALVGRTLGTRTWLREGATVQGSLAFLIVGSGVGWVLVSGVLPWPLLDLPFPAVLAGAVVATFLEASPLPINDNLTAPLGAAVVIVGIMSLWPI